MCFGGSRASSPQVVMQGPSQADIDRQNAAMDSYRQQAAEQQRLLTEQLQRQINDANAAMAKQKEQLAAEQAATAARAAQTQQGAYATQTAAATPAAAQSTTAPAERRNPRTSLKIAPGSTAASAGAGLNIGT